MSNSFLHFTTLRILLILLLLQGLNSCTPEEKIKGYAETDTHLFYKLLAFGEGKKHPVAGENLVLTASYKTQKDSIFWDTEHDAHLGYYIVFKDRCQMGCFNEYFPKMVEGDSLSFIVKKEVFYKEIFNSAVPLFSEKDSVVKVNLKLIKILDGKGVGEYLQKQKKAAKANEQLLIAHYVKENFKDTTKLWNGMYVEFTKRSTDTNRVFKGKRLSLIYKGYYLDGKLLDFTPKDKPFELTYGEQGQLLPGLLYGISLMKKGEIAKIILPSRFAFGEQGNSNGTIAPFTPLMYEVQLTDVK